MSDLVERSKDKKAPTRAGLHRGVEMATSPSPDRLRAMSREAAEMDSVTTSWTEVGDFLRAAMAETATAHSSPRR